MRKLLLLFIVGSLIFSGLGASGTNINNEKINYDINEEHYEKNDRDYTHTVLVEVGTGTWCPSCPASNSAWHNIYETGDYDFEYVELVEDKNSKARSRFDQFNPRYVPTSYWDGGEFAYPGTSTGTFKSYLDSSGSRAVPDLDSSLTVKWLGNAKLEISLSVENNDVDDYEGRIRVYVLELVSPRWNDYSGNPYYHAFLDFPWDNSIDIDSGGEYQQTKVWDGAAAGYSNIEPDNIQVILSVFGDTPHQGYSDPPSGNPFTAYYADETIAALVDENQPPDKPIVSGPIDGEPNIEYEYTIEITDADGDDMYLWIDWGDETQGWLGPYTSGSVHNIMHTWEDPGVFEVRAKTRDVNYEESQWSDSLIVSIGNLAPNKPEINGPPSGLIDSDIEFTFVATDPNNDQLLYYIDWGDGNTEEWIGPYNSGEEVVLTHSWNEEKRFSVKAKVKDPDGLETGWTYHNINIPRTRFTHNIYIAKIFERFSVLYQILHNILG
jgi:hypothetical protein